MRVRVIDLAGPWRLGWWDTRRGDAAFRDHDAHEHRDWMRATVPGEVHRALEAEGILAPIEEGLGVLAARWVESTVWIYATEFEVDARDATARIAELVFDRVELAARVYLNGRLAATHRSAYRPLRIDVTDHLVVGRNLLRVEVDSGYLDIADLPAKDYRRTVRQTASKRHWLRTSQSQFSWDWAPQLITIGITGGVRLEVRDQPVRLVTTVPLITLDDDLAHARVACAVHVRSLGEADVRVTLDIDGRPASSQIAHVAPGDTRVDLAFDVDDPGVWWPGGWGAQRSYALTTHLAIGEAVVDTRVDRIGFRSIVVDESPAPGGGRHFRLIVNGRPFFARGANWVPLSLTPFPVDHELLERQLDRAVEAGMNFLRVWGGGQYESDAFYRACNERGILVWQDFMFACTRYPTGDPAFRAEALAEATYQVRRLASHPSLVVWAGNNENAWIAQSAVHPGPLVASVDAVPGDLVSVEHDEFFAGRLASLVNAEDPGRYYLPSSPWSGEHPDHNAGSEGDQHVWDVGFADVDFRRYRDIDARFADEGGLLGPTTMPALQRSLPGGQQHYGSFSWKVHDNQVAQDYAHRPMEQLLRDWTGRDIATLELDAYVYWTGLVQAEALTELIDNFRRRPTSGAAVFWMFNDCWPAVRSWSIVDDRGHRTPAFHPVRRAFAPLRVGLVRMGGDVRVWARNDTLTTAELTLRAGIAKLSGGLDLDEVRVTLPPAGVSDVHVLTGAAPRGDAVHVAELVDGGATVSSNRLLDGTFAELAWAPSQIDMDVIDGTAHVRSDVYELGVCLDLNGDAQLGDNFFDLLPGVPRTMPWPHAQPPRVLFTGNSAAQGA